MKKLCAAGVVAVILLAIATWTHAQGQRLAEPRVISGNDIGFRMDGTDINGRPTGVWVIRVDGRWVEQGMSSTIRPAK